MTPMPNCKFCGEEVVVATVFHPGCLHKKLSSIRERMCDKFCMWPRICQDEDRLLDHHCSICPMLEMMDIWPSNQES